jgi:peptidoglycan/LPS O-acetylase OafA/YrhL
MSASVNGLASAPHVQVLQAVAAYLYLGVDLFFVLSGYLITSLLLLARRSQNYYRNFYWKRVFRILPALILILLLARLIFTVRWSGILAALFFIANITSVWGVPEVGQFWSLAIEEQFYLLWPTVIHRTRPRTILRILLTLIVASPLLRILSNALHHGNNRYTPLHCDGLAWGALIAVMAFHARIPFHGLNAPALWRRAGRFMLSGGVALMVVAFFVLHILHNDFGLLLSASGPLFAGILLYLLTHRRGLAARSLASRPMHFLGDISYMVYLSHAYILELYDRHIRSWSIHPTESGLYLRFVVILVLSLLWSALSLSAFEHPVGKLRRYFVRPD